MIIAVLFRYISDYFCYYKVLENKVFLLKGKKEKFKFKYNFLQTFKPKWNYWMFSISIFLWSPAESKQKWKLKQNKTMIFGQNRKIK
jgi:hypothetical protein